VPLVQYLQGRGVKVEVAAFAESTNAQLKAVTDVFFDLSTEGREFLINPKRRSLPGRPAANDDLDLDLGKGGGKTRRVKVTF